jgi:hypothetical protein
MAARQNRPLDEGQCLTVVANPDREGCQCPDTPLTRCRLKSSAGISSGSGKGSAALLPRGGWRVAKQRLAVVHRRWQRGLYRLDRCGAELLFQVLTEREEKISVAVASDESFSGIRTASRTAETNKPPAETAGAGQPRCSMASGFDWPFIQAFFVGAVSLLPGRLIGAVSNSIAGVPAGEHDGGKHGQSCEA